MIYYLPLPPDLWPYPPPDRGGRGALGFCQSLRGAPCTDCDRGVGGVPVFPHVSRWCERCVRALDPGAPCGLRG